MCFLFSKYSSLYFEFPCFVFFVGRVRVFRGGVFLGEISLLHVPCVLVCFISLLTLFALLVIFLLRFCISLHYSHSLLFSYSLYFSPYIIRTPCYFHTPFLFLLTLFALTIVFLLPFFFSLHYSHSYHFPTPFLFLLTLFALPIVFLPPFFFSLHYSHSLYFPTPFLFLLTLFALLVIFLLPFSSKSLAFFPLSLSRFLPRFLNLNYLSFFLCFSLGNHVVAAGVLDCNTVVSEFELQSRYYVLLSDNYSWGRYEPPYTPSTMGYIVPLLSF